MKPEAKYFSTQLGKKEVSFETGRIARLAGGSVILRQGDSMMFAAATMGGVREGTDFFPLTVDYEERMYAGGKIPGSFFRREGRPSTDATLVARITDRPLRPLFPEGMRNEVQVVLMSLSADTENPLDMLAINAASAALMISDIPFDGPVGAVRIGFVDGELVVNPTLQQMEVSTLDLRVAGTKEALLMVEAGANEVTEVLMAEALQLAHQSIQPIIQTQLQMAAELGKTKKVVKLAEKDLNLIAQAKEAIRYRLETLLDQEYSKDTMYGGIADIKEAYLLEQAGEEATPETLNAYAAAFEEAEKPSSANASSIKANAPTTAKFSKFVRSTARSTLLPEPMVPVCSPAVKPRCSPWQLLVPPRKPRNWTTSMAWTPSATCIITTSHPTPPERQNASVVSQDAKLVMVL